MGHRRKVVMAAALFLAAALVLSVAGCDQSTESDGSTTTTELPPQDGLEVGEVAPDFRMQSQDQVTVTLKDYAGTKNVILVFYPADFTPV